MKKITILLLAVLFASLTMAQPAYTQEQLPLKNHKPLPSYIGMIEIGYLSGIAQRDDWSGQRQVYTSPTVQLYNGYRINQYFAIGGTTGIDYYENLLLVPFALGIRGNLLPSRVSPIYSVDAGYSAAFLNPHSRGYRTEGGWMFNPALGLRVDTGNNTAFTFVAGYKTQKALTEFQNFGWGGAGTTRQHITYNRLVLRLGFLF